MGRCGRTSTQGAKRKMESLILLRRTNCHLAAVVQSGFHMDIGPTCPY